MCAGFPRKSREKPAEKICKLLLPAKGFPLLLCIWSGVGWDSYGKRRKETWIMKTQAAFLQPSIRFFFCAWTGEELLQQAGERKLGIQRSKFLFSSSTLNFPSVHGAEGKHLRVYCRKAAPIFVIQASFFKPFLEFPSAYPPLASSSFTPCASQC